MSPPVATEASPSAPAPPPKPWPGPVRGSHRMGYQGPGVPLYSLRGARQAIRERWRRRVLANTTLTFSAWAVGIVLADHGNRDGTCIYPSQELLAKELNLSTGTASRAVCELEDAGFLRVRRSKPRRDCETGRFGRSDTNRYTLCVPPENASERAIKGQRRKRHGCPGDARRAAQERRRAETLARLAASVGDEEAQRLAHSQALGAFRPARNEACTCGSGAKSKACCGTDRGPGPAGQPILGGSPPPSPPGAGEPASRLTGPPFHEVTPEGPGHEGGGVPDEGIVGDGQSPPADGANPWTALKGILGAPGRRGP